MQGYERVVGPLHTETLWALFHLQETLERAGRLAEAQLVAAETLKRFSRVKGVSHFDTALQMTATIRLLRADRNAAGMRDLAEDWIGRVLESPSDPEPWSRHRRSVMLCDLARVLVTLPRAITIDAPLAVRAAEQSVALDGDRGGARTVLALANDRAGRLDEAMRAIRASMERPDREGGDDFDWLVLALIHARRGELDRRGRGTTRPGVNPTPSPSVATTYCPSATRWKPCWE